MLSSTARLAVLPLLGITLQQLIVYELIVLPVILFHHSNVRIPAGADRLLRLVTVTPRMHWIHHSVVPAELNSNYASELSIWDRLFGTYVYRDSPDTLRLGLRGWDEDEWRSPARLWLAPFRRRAALRPQPKAEETGGPEESGGE